MELTYNLGKMILPATGRPGKGKSIIAFPAEYCMVDIETTGLSPRWNDIIEIGAIRYRDGIEIGRFQSLVKPPLSEEGIYVDSFIESLTGITNDMLSTAPEQEIVLREFLDFVQDCVIFGYNTCFDVSFIYDRVYLCLNEIFSNDYVDVRRLARKICPKLPRYRLKDLADYYDIDNLQAHRTINDCIVTEQVFRKLFSEGLICFGSEKGIIDAFNSNGSCYKKVKACDIVGDETRNDPDCPIYGQHCVITGQLERFTRAGAMQMIADLGGINENNVTKNTNFLILGNNDYCATIKDGKSRKQKKAEEYKLKGQEIEILPETVFYDMIADYLSEAEFDQDAQNGEDLVLEHFSEVIRAQYPDAVVTIEDRSTNYRSLCFNGTDVLRVRYTDRTKWISIDAWSAKLEPDDPRFEGQNNKAQRHWKARVNDISAIDEFDKDIIKACNTCMLM